MSSVLVCDAVRFSGAVRFGSVCCLDFGLVHTCYARIYIECTCHTHCTTSGGETTITVHVSAGRRVLYCTCEKSKEVTLRALP